MIYLSILLTMSGCFTPSKEKRIHRDISSLQSRLASIESNQKTVPAKQNKTIASASSEIEKLRQDIRRMNGELDRLTVGVKSGTLPGEPEDAGSVGSSIKELADRMHEVETNQETMLAMLEKAIGRKNKSKKLSSIDELQSAFKKKRYLYVINSAKKIIKKQRNRKNRELGLFLYSESLFKVGKLQDAALSFNDFIDKFPSSKNMAHAKMRMGDCFRHIGDKAASRSYYKEVIDKFSNSAEAKKSKERITKL